MYMELYFYLWFRFSIIRLRDKDPISQRFVLISRPLVVITGIAKPSASNLV